MRRSIKRFTAVCMAAVCMSGVVGCSAVDKIIGSGKMEYSVAGKPVDDNNNFYALNGSYTRDGYSIDSPVFLLSDKEIAIAYSGEKDTVLARYDFVNGKTVKEVTIESGLKMISCADNGNMLFKKESEETSSFYVYDSELKLILDSSDKKISVSDMVMSSNGETLAYSSSDGTQISTYSLKDGSESKIYNISDDGYTAETAQIYVSKILGDASSMILTMNIFSPSFSTVSYVYDIANKSKNQIDLKGSDIEVMGDKYITYNISSGDNHIKIYDAAGIVDGTCTETAVEVGQEMAVSKLDTTAGYMITEVINKGNPEYQDGLHVRYYSLEDGLVKQSVLASVSNIFTIIGDEKSYKDNNEKSWFEGVIPGNRASIEVTSDKSMAIVSIEDSQGVRVFVWKLNVNTEDSKDSEDAK